MALALLGAAACGRTPDPSPAPSASLAGAVASAPSAAPPPSGAPGSSASPVAPGSFSGTYEVSARRIDVPLARGGLPEWTVDDGKRGVGSGTLELQVGPDGSVTGVGRGVLGDQRITGSIDGSALTARLESAAPGGYGGTLTAEVSGPRLSGTLRVSTGDSQTARTGSALLMRK